MRAWRAALRRWREDQAVSIEALLRGGDDVGRLANLRKQPRLAGVGFRPLLSSSARIAATSLSPGVKWKSMSAAMPSGVMLVTGAARVIPPLTCDETVCGRAAFGRLATNRFAETRPIAAMSRLTVR